ncbi:MAG: hypothetical protein SFV81_05640 [Pirellulaceae bacterium]|nr:hypothetical protein [Pirellulaceae bacterium]
MTVFMELPDYAVSPNPDLWEVTENGEAFVWSDTHRTAALSVQVEAVCGPVLRKRGGLPSLTAVLFLIEAMTAPMDVATAKARVGELMRPVSHIIRDNSDRIVRWLVACGQLEADLRKGPARQGTLLNDLMENAPSSMLDLQALQAIEAMHWLRLSLLDREVIYNRPRFVSQFKSALAINTLLHFANSPMNDASVRLRMQTGLDEVPEDDVDTEVPPARQYSQLLSDLRDDDELGQFIQMAANAASMLALPRRPSDPDELQVGGVSDITNRGQPERLLATELAADPDLLMARIAHGQALYLRRESPPQHTVLRRRVLIENGVRMWGLTRLRATAFALAVAASEDRNRGPQLDVITVAGASFWSDDLSTRAGLVTQLARLEPDAHPGDALVQLAASWEEDAEAFAEPLLIVSRNTYRDPDFQKCLIEFPRPYLLARIDQEGQVELLQCTRSGDSVFHKQRMALPLKKLVSSKGPMVHLPMFLQQSPCPLRFTADLSARWSIPGDGPSLWTLTHDRRLMRFDAAGIGAIEVLSLPGEILRASAGKTDIDLVVAEPIANTQKVRHLLVRVSDAEEPQVFHLDSGSEQHHVRFEFDSDLLRIGRDLTIFDAHGKILAAEPLGDKRHIGGRFFYEETFVWAAMHDQGKVQWHKLGQTQFYPGFAFQNEVDCVSVYSFDFAHFQLLDGGNNARSTGIVIDCKPAPKLLFRQSGCVIVEVESPASSANSTRSSSVVHQHHGRRYLRLLHEQVSEVNYYATVLNGLNNKQPKFATSQSVRSRLHGVAVVDGKIVLFRNPSLGFAIDVATDPKQSRRLILKHIKLTSPIEIVQFERESKVENSPFPHHWMLKKAILPQGCVWLDSRGLLHLRGHDDSELSLVLHDAHLSGWHSDGSVFGLQYFINRPDTPLPSSVEAWLNAWASSL